MTITAGTKQPELKRRIFWTLVKAGLGIGLLVFLLMKIPLEKVAAEFSRTRMWPVVLAVILQIAAMAVSTLRWRLILLSRNVSARWRDLFNLHMSGLFLSNFLPTSVGGDLYRMWGVKGGDENRVAAVMSVPVERFISIAAAILAGLAGCMLRPGMAYRSGAFWLLAAGAVGVGLVLLARSPWLRGRFPGVGISGDGRIASWLDALYGEASSYSVFNPLILKAFFFSLVFQLTAVFNVWLYSVALGVSPAAGLPELLLFVPAIVVISSIPLSINALGISEGAFVFFLVFAGVSAESALAMAFLGRIIRWGVSLLGALFFISGRGRGRVTT